MTHRSSTRAMNYLVPESDQRSIIKNVVLLLDYMLHNVTKFLRFPYLSRSCCLRIIVCVFLFMIDLKARVQYQIKTSISRDSYSNRHFFYYFILRVFLCSKSYYKLLSLYKLLIIIFFIPGKSITSISYHRLSEIKW